MDAVIEIAVQKLGYREMKNLQTRFINEGNNVFQCYQYVLGT